MDTRIMPESQARHTDVRLYRQCIKTAAREDRRGLVEKHGKTEALALAVGFVISIMQLIYLQSVSPPTGAEPKWWIVWLPLVAYPVLALTLTWLTFFWVSRWRAGARYARHIDWKRRLVEVERDALAEEVDSASEEPPAIEHPVAKVWPQGSELKIEAHGPQVRRSGQVFGIKTSMPVECLLMADVATLQFFIRLRPTGKEYLCDLATGKGRKERQLYLTEKQPVTVNAHCFIEAPSDCKNLRNYSAKQAIAGADLVVRNIAHPDECEAEISPFSAQAPAITMSVLRTPTLPNQ